MKAKCTYYGKCSGCTLQQFPYVKQLYDKSRRVSSDLAPLLPKGLDKATAILAVKASPLEQGYRTSGKLCLHEDELGRRSIGLYERASKKVAAIPECTVHHPEINKMVEKLFGFGKKLPAPLYQHNKKGFQTARLKFLILRYSPETKEFGLVLSHTGVGRQNLIEWTKGLDLRNVALYESVLTPEDGDLVLARDCSHLAGLKTFRFQIGKRIYSIDPIAFFQANHSLASDFVDSIAAYHQGNCLLDLYGGFGSYSFAAKERFEKIIVVEANPHSIASANEYLDRTSISGVTTQAETVEDFLKTALRDTELRGSVTDIIINPPRTGISKLVIEGLRSAHWQNLERMTYVSCDLGTLKRDLRELVRGQVFEISEILPFDMFPQTDHIETVVRLKRNKTPVISEKIPSSVAPKGRAPSSSRVPQSRPSDPGNRPARNPLPQGASRSGTRGKPKVATRKFHSPEG